MRTYMFWLAIGAAACGSNAAKRVGETCTASSECDTGLLCDLNQSPHSCVSMGSLDASEEVDGSIIHHIDGGSIDAKAIDARPIDARPIDAPADAPPDAPP